MTNLPVVSAQDGNALTVNDWIKSPLVLPQYILDETLAQGFLADVLFRNAGGNDSGLVRYNETTPLYLDSNLVVRSEFGEIPVGQGSLGGMNHVTTTETSLGLVISDWMRNRNDIGALDLKVRQAKNTMVRSWDDTFIQTFVNNANIPTGPASAHWSIADTDIRGDILTAMKAIESAQDGQNSELGYECDTMLVNRANKYDVIKSPQFNHEYYGGDVADQNLRLTGVLPQKILGLNVIASPRVPAGTVIFMQRGNTGFYSDEVPLTMTALYRDEDRKCSRTNIVRQTALGIDQPKSAYILTGTS